MARIPEHVLRQLQTVLIPGMEMAVQNLVNELNQIRIATGQAPDYAITLSGVRLGDTGEEAPVLTTRGRPRKRELSPESLASISAAQKKRWAKAKRNGTGKETKIHDDGLTPVPVTRSAETRERMRQALRRFKPVPAEEIITWAKRHHGHFSIAKFKELHPKAHLRAIGLLVSRGIFKQTGKGEYDYMGARPERTERLAETA